MSIGECGEHWLKVRDIVAIREYLALRKWTMNNS